MDVKWTRGFRGARRLQSLRMMIRSLKSGRATLLPRLRRALSTAGAEEIEWSAAGADFEAAARVASTVLACAPAKGLAPGDVLVNLGADSLTGSMITQGADKLGLTVVSVVPEGVAPGLHDTTDENKYYVNQQYAFHGATVAITDRFVNFRGFDELMADVGAPALVINGTGTVAAGQEALKAFAKAKTFTAKKAAIEDMQDEGTLFAAKYASSLGKALGKAPVFSYDADKPDVAALMSKASAEQKELASDVYHLLTTYDDDEY